MTRLFLYGTLKHGGSNHRRMVGQGYVGPAATAPRYRLFDLGPFPGLVDAAGGVSVRGELWEVTPECLAALDQFEGIDVGLFRRGEIELADGTRVQGYFFTEDVNGHRDIGEEYCVGVRKA
jgi:gamma-glutamylaminecyclotransferase